jgi:hypothetical protein
MLSITKSRAKQAGIDFNLTIEDVVIPSHCPIFEMELKHGKGTTAPSSPTLDRLDSSKGYVKGNVNVISHKANSLKGHGTAEQHRRIADWMESLK